MGLDTSGWFMNNAQNPALYKIGETLERAGERKQDMAMHQQQIDYRNQKDKEADQWRNIGLIQKETDISKNLTGMPAINKAYQQATKKVIDEAYAAANNGVSPLELGVMINEKMNPIFAGLDASKRDFESGNKVVEGVLAQAKQLDKGGIVNDLTGRIISNYLNPDGTAKDPYTVREVDVTEYANPRFLSRFAKGNKALTEGIINPKGLEPESVLMGKQGDYTKFEGKLPFWKTRNYDRTKFNNEGFYTGKEIPTFNIKETTLSADSLPSSNGKPFKMVDTDVYNQFKGDLGSYTDIVASAKERFPTYDNFNETEKEYAERHVLHGILGSLDQSQLHPTSNVRPPVNRTTNNNYIGGADGLQLNKIQERLIKNISEDLDKGYNVTRWNKLKADEGALISKYATENGVTINPKMDFVRLNENGEVEVYEVPTKDDGSQDLDNVIKPENLKLTLPKGAFADIRNQSNVKAKNQRTAEANTQGNKKPTGKTEDLRKKYNY